MRDLTDQEAKSLAIGEEHYMAYVGPPDQYDLIGASQFCLLITLGLRDTHRVLDFGCGSLRLGRLLIPYLLPGNYTGLEPNTWLVSDGLARQLGNEILRVKSPRFFDHDDFRADRCGSGFDVIIAQSIFSHAGADVISTALHSFAAALADDGMVVLTVLHPGQSGGIPEFTGSGWLYPTSVAHRPETLSRIFIRAGFEHFRTLPWFHPRQTWYALAKQPGRLPGPQQDKFLSGAILNTADWNLSTL